MVQLEDGFADETVGIPEFRAGVIGGALTLVHDNGDFDGAARLFEKGAGFINGHSKQIDENLA